MVRVRTLTVLLVVIALAGVACGSDSETEVAALEQRISELEASTTTPASTTTTTQPTATSSSTTTTIPVTTTTEAEYDLTELDLATLSQWAATDRVDRDFVLFASSSCENAVDSLATLSRVLAWESALAGGLLSDAHDGTGTVADAAAAFDVLTAAIPYAGRAANILLELSTIGGATGFAELFRDSAVNSILGIGAIPLFVLDEEAGTINEEALGVWGQGFLDSIAEFDSLGSRSWSEYCP